MHVLVVLVVAAVVVVVASNVHSGPLEGHPHRAPSKFGAPKCLRLRSVKYFAASHLMVIVVCGGVCVCHILSEVWISTRTHTRSP